MGEHFKGIYLPVSPILSLFLRKSPWGEHFQKLKISTVLLSSPKNSNLLLQRYPLNRRSSYQRICIGNHNGYPRISIGESEMLYGYVWISIGICVHNLMQDRLAQGLIHSHSCPAQLLCPRQEWVQPVCPQRCVRVGSQWSEQE